MLNHAWIIPLIPAVSFFLIIGLGKKMPMKGSEIGLVSIFTSLVLALITAVQWINHTNAAVTGGEAGASDGAAHEAIVKPVIKVFTWWQSGGVKFGWGSHIDGLAVALLVVVTIISSCVHVFSLEYLRGDRRYTHYFAALSLFTAGMLNLVVAENTIQLLLGWEIMGLCSFMLIGHWWEEEANSRAALKAFFTTRTGDIGLLVGISIVYFATKSFSIETINQTVTDGKVSHLVILMGAIALFIAVIGKSGQFPLHTWLPDAMAGPTPVSALIHAATMVVAGVYLVARLYPVFVSGFSIGTNVTIGGLNPMALIGGITIVIAAGLAFVQNDIKKVLAYSTVSQLGYMIMGLGVGAWTPAVFHIFTHAFFKALLFLGAGSIAHSGSHHSFDMKESMGGLRKYMPITFWTFIVGTLALSGIFPFAGFFSKDEILAFAGHHGYHSFMYIGLVGAFMTAAYMTRCVWLTFFGEYRGGHAAHDDHHTVALVAHDADVHADHHDAHAEPHESPWLITGPLILLAVLATVVGFLNAAPFKIEKFTEWVQPRIAFPEISVPDFSWLEAGESLAIAMAGILIAAALWSKDLGRLRGLTKRNKLAHAGYTFLWNKYYLDHLYEGIIVAGITGPIARGAYWINQKLIDGTVNGVGIGAREAGKWVYKNIDQKIVDGAVNGAGMAASETGGLLRGLQTGKVQQYGALLFGSSAIIGLIFVIVIK